MAEAAALGLPLNGTLRVLASAVVLSLEAVLFGVVQELFAGIHRLVTQAYPPPPESLPRSVVDMPTYKRAVVGSFRGALLAEAQDQLDRQVALGTAIEARILAMAGVALAPVGFVTTGAASGRIVPNLALASDVAFLAAVGCGVSILFGTYVLGPNVVASHRGAAQAEELADGVPAADQASAAAFLVTLEFHVLNNYWRLWRASLVFRISLVPFLGGVLLAGLSFILR